MKTQSKSLMCETGYNPILDSDSYKIGHWLQQPEGATAMFAYFESRGGKYDYTLMFGLQYILQKYLEVQIKMWMVDEAEAMVKSHLGSTKSFNRKGWEYIIEKYDGYIPVKIKAVPEGMVIPTRNILFGVECYDPKAFFTVTYIETLLVRTWSPITTATKSFAAKRIILDAAEKSSDEPTENLFAVMKETGIPPLRLFGLHDFGGRGGSSYETSSWAGAAHLVNFLGTDTLSAIKLVLEHYGENCAGFSIDASEHSTMTALGPDGEIVQFKRMIEKFGDRYMFACVSDGFNIWNAIKNGWGGELLEQVKAMNAILVVRPDSGDAIEVPVRCVEMLDDAFGHTVNSKGYKVLEYVRVIQGDGINNDDIQGIADLLLSKGYSIDDMAFGMGGGLIQDQTRDTQKFAMKNSWMLINGEEVNVYKDPITDPGKKSKKGRMVMIQDEEGEFHTMTELTEDEFENPEDHFKGRSILETVFDDGMVQKAYTFQTIRETAETFL